MEADHDRKHDYELHRSLRHRHDQAVLVREHLREAERLWRLR